MINAESSDDKPGLHEAMFYEKLPDKKIKCTICPRYCVVSPGNRGYCRNKENREGIYYTLAHSKACSTAIDPVEKKPLFHFLPGRRAFSLATAGCNFQCQNCQNWQISQSDPDKLKSQDLFPQTIVTICREKEIPVIAFTYSEPTVFYEYMHDTAKIARGNGIASVMISNGYINEKPLKRLCQELSAVKIDLKSFSDEFYRKICGGQLQPVLDTLLTLKKIGIWFEIVTLIIPSLNDSEGEIEKMCLWIKENLGTNIPLHFSRFTPTYKLTNLPQTPVSTLVKAYNIARTTGLNFVYLGNVSPHDYESTYCPNCKTTLIKRTAFDVKTISLKNGKCSSCQTSIPGVWQVK
ncbi:MAG: AmmeMemoRadiSam system radical SAM enzyme [Planctomycetes bacterium]|nr:AmmeMemoRadiSam system radical SAM enzyme [Planctomycetota bacterium]